MTYTALKTLALMFVLGMGVVNLKQRQTEQSYRLNHVLKLESTFNNRLTFLRAQLGQLTSPLKAKELAEKEKWDVLDPYKKIIVFKTKNLSHQSSNLLPAIVSR